LHLPHDAKRRLNLEYEGYSGQQIKQADVVLVGFPLMWPISKKVRQNDLFYYENRTRSTGPAMTWG
jgi:protein-glucosylgalactosylhydroxylysine glucosidase